MIETILLAIKDEDDRDFVAEIFEKYEKKLFVKAQSVTNCEQDSEDCVLDVIIVIVDQLEFFRTLDKKGQVLYMLRCCENIAIDKYRRNKYKSKHEYSTDDNFESCIDDEENQLDIIISEENCKRILDLIETMDPRQRDILYFRCIAGMEYEDLAKMLDIPVKQVYVRVHRARQALLKTHGDKINEILRK